jgi:hypothetical protein
MTGISFTPTPVFYVIIGFIFGIALGWVIGFFDSNSRTAKKIAVAESKADQILKEAEKKISQAEQQIALASQGSPGSQDSPGLLRLKNDAGRFTLEIDGVPVTSPLSPDKRKRLIELITVFRPWIEGGQPSQSVQQPVAPVQVLSTQGAQPVQVSSPQGAPVQPAGSRPNQPGTPAAEKNIASMSIVNQIDTVLQARLVDTPLAKRGIRLQESLQGGVEVYVGIEKYSTIDDVADETIRNAIRAAIAEWEDKYTPGLSR